jgi:putative membrane-bound dehydrogenase-like protein
MLRRSLLGAFVCFLLLVWALPAQKGDKSKSERPPHGQDQLPGPPLSPAEAVKKMTVPKDFSVEVVLSEPNLVNPVAMCFDERGRIWVTESVEYPRRSAGPGKDRIKVFESTRGDGKYDRMTVFAEGLNIPSGIAVGHGGVWVANSPDILFYKEGPDGKAAGKPEVVVTGFGRDDTHELPNSLTWGPDGYLYGLNGVFNHSKVKQDGKTFDFTCALFRIHPSTRKFELFCEGTSNPWGIAIDGEGSFFVSACVIDHLWHLVETGYYHRQGGPYPPFTWKIDSIVKHRHQKAAYCGIVWFDSDAYPAQYREKLYMGNIHGNCINGDELTRDGSTYFGKPRPDFLTANDAWFMPVSQKVGPDGCLYILDWYDRYHCYQDANRDPAGIDRERGRLYRIRYKNTPPAGKFDLAKENDEKLLDRLGSPNVYYREQAQRLLTERNTASIRAALEKIVLDDKATRKQRMHALWARIGSGALGFDFHTALLAHKDPTFRAWGVRAASNYPPTLDKFRKMIIATASDPDPDVQLQVAIAARNIEGLNTPQVLLGLLQKCGDDKLIPHIVWGNLLPSLEEPMPVLEYLNRAEIKKKSPGLIAILPRVVDRILARRQFDPRTISALYFVVAHGPAADVAATKQFLAGLAARLQTGEISREKVADIKRNLSQTLMKIMNPNKAEYHDAALLAATLNIPSGVEAAQKFLLAKELSAAIRVRALDALIAAQDTTILKTVGDLLTENKSDRKFRGQLIAALGRLDDLKVADTVLAAFPKLESDVQPAAIDLLSQRADWGKKLLKAIADKKVSAAALSVNQVRKLIATRDRELIDLVKKQWGTLREDRNPERERIVNEMRDFLKKTRGDALAGQKIFQNVCAKCHKIHGEGQDVGPDITNNGRSTFDQLLSNVFDPSLVIGAAYQATTVQTTKGRALTGLVVENSPERVILKMEGGKLETIPRDQIEEVTISKVSLMPEGLEKQMKPQELADLFAFLSLDKAPSDPSARKIPGAP